MRKLRPRELRNLPEVLQLLRRAQLQFTSWALFPEPVLQTFTVSPQPLESQGLLWYSLVVWALWFLLRLVSLKLEFGIVLLCGPDLFSAEQKCILVIKWVKTQSSSTCSGQSKMSVRTRDKGWMWKHWKRWLLVATLDCRMHESC